MKRGYKLFLILLILADCALIYILGMRYFSNKNVLTTDDTAKAAVIENPLNNSDFQPESYDDISMSNTSKMVIPSGEPIGIYVKSEGVMVIGVGEIKGEDGGVYMPCLNLVKQGDYIIGVNGAKINDKTELIEIVNKCNDDYVELQIKSYNNVSSNSDIEIFNVKVKPVKSEDGNYMLGLWVKDDISGIGTLTYYDEDSFGALGHSINDNDTGEVFAISDGAIYSTDLVNIIKSGSNNPGRLEGMIDYSSKNMVGRVEKNDTFGISGYLTNAGKNKLDDGNYMPVATKNQVRLGDAFILSSITGEEKYYSIKITNIQYENIDDNKELQIEITDPELINITSGIVQGMSGTPIIQDGRLVGAVTHVLVNDPTKGYGIFIESMMN